MFVFSNRPLRVCAGTTSPNIAQLVERSTVDVAGIEWSLVRFRVFGFFDSGMVGQWQGSQRIFVDAGYLLQAALV